MARTSGSVPDILGFAAIQQGRLEEIGRDHLFVRQQGYLNWVRRAEDGKVLAAESLEWQTQSIAFRRSHLSATVSSLIKSILRMGRTFVTWVMTAASSLMWFI